MTDKNPLPIPKVRVVDEAGRICCEGYYIAYPERMGYPLIERGEKPDEIPLVELVAVVEYGDWGLNNQLRLMRVTPPHRIEIIGSAVAAKPPRPGDDEPTAEELENS